MARKTKSELIVETEKLLQGKDIGTLLFNYFSSNELEEFNEFLENE